MYSRLLESYPETLWEGDEAPRFRPLLSASGQHTRDCRRGCRVTVGSSAENQEAVRGADYTRWRTCRKRLLECYGAPCTPEQFIRAVCGAIALVPYSLIAMESTANGVGNYFHSEWLRCRDGRGDKHAVFVPWHEIEIYRLDPPDAAALPASLSAGKGRCGSRGCASTRSTGIAARLRSTAACRRCAPSFPLPTRRLSLPPGRGVFPHDRVESMRRGLRRKRCPRRGRYRRAPFCGRRGGGMYAHVGGASGGSAYVVAVDVGGRSESSDWSVIAVMRRPSASRPAEVAAQWRGHVDHDLLGTQGWR